MTIANFQKYFLVCLSSILSGSLLSSLLTMLKMRSTVLTTEESNTLITIVNYLKLNTSLTTNEPRYMHRIRK